jgi:hypothetical protein
MMRADYNMLLKRKRRVEQRLREANLDAGCRGSEKGCSYGGGRRVRMRLKVGCRHARNKRSCE